MSELEASRLLQAEPSVFPRPMVHRSGAPSCSRPQSFALGASCAHLYRLQGHRSLKALCAISAWALLLAFLANVSLSYGFGLPGFLGGDGDSGSGKVAHLEFHLDDATFAPTSVVWSPDGRFIATSGTQTRSIHIWDVAQRKLVKELELPNMPASLFHNMAWSPDGRYLATCNSADTSLRIYATKDWSVAKDFGREIAGACQKPAFSSDGKELTMWGGDLITFATNDWHEIRLLKGMRVEGTRVIGIENEWDKGMLLHDMAYVPGTHTLVFGAGAFTKGTGVCEPAPDPYDPFAGLLLILKPRETALSHRIVVYCQPHGADVSLIAVHPDGQRVATVTGASTGSPGAAAENNTKVISLLDGRSITPALAWHSGNSPGGLAYTPDGRYLLVGNGGPYHNDHSVYIVDAQTMQLLDTVHAPPNIGDIAVAPDSTMFAVATGAGVTVWKFVQP